MTTQTPTRLQTKVRVARTLSKAVILQPGPMKLGILGRGNPFVREDGTAVHIFNTLSFRSQADAQEAARLWKEGSKLEAKGKLEDAHELYIQALNMLASFSVLEQNATAFQEAYQINGLVELVENRDGDMILAINNPRPVSVTETGSNVAAMFADDEDAEENAPAPVTTTKATKPAAGGAIAAASNRRRANASA